MVLFNFHIYHSNECNFFSCMPKKGVSYTSLNKQTLIPRNILCGRYKLSARLEPSGSARYARVLYIYYTIYILNSMVDSMPG